MPRPNQTAERREELVPIIAGTFAELGYRRTTTAELARRCGVRENILYRLWPDKQAMFIASIHHLHHMAEESWGRLTEEADGPHTPAERLLAYESKHYGETHTHRIAFAGLNEVDEPPIRDALGKMYERFHGMIASHIRDHRRRQGRRKSRDEDLAAWAIVGLATISDIGREVGLIDDRKREKLIGEMGRVLLEGRAANTNGKKSK